MEYINFEAEDEAENAEDEEELVFSDQDPIQHPTP